MVEFAPEVMVLTCCGYKLARVEQEAHGLTQFDGIFDIPAVRNNRVYATNGSDYFSRPGPRIVDSLEILAHLVHPEMFSAPQFENAFFNRGSPASIGAIEKLSGFENGLKPDSYDSSCRCTAMSTVRRR